MKTSISGTTTNTTSHTFIPLFGASFINDCQRQPVLHVNHPLLSVVKV